MSGKSLRRIGGVSLTLLGQWLLGAVFLFSGFVKAADPLGMEHKLEAYFRAMGMDLSGIGIQLVAGSAVLDIMVVFIALVEFLIGMYYALGMHQRTTVVFGSLLLGFMTAITFWVYLYDPVPDCGCFGDAIVLSNAQTLAKNVVLLIVALLLLGFRGGMIRCLSPRNEWFATTTSFLYVLILSAYSMRQLPLVDFTGYGVGTDLRSALYGEYRTRYVYERDGEQRTFYDGAVLPDSTWRMVSAESEEVVPPRIKDFSFVDAEGTDIGEEILASAGYTFLLTLPGSNTADAGCSDQINDVCDFAGDHDIPMWCATSLDADEQREWSDRTGASYPFATAGSETLKAMVRSNPGLLLIHDGHIIAKWGHHEMPDGETLTMPMLDAMSRQAPTLSHQRIYFLLTGVFIGILLVVVLCDRLWAGNRYYRRIRRARLWRSQAAAGDAERKTEGNLPQNPS